MMKTVRYSIYGKHKNDNDPMIDCSFDNKQVAVDCLIHYINYLALKRRIRIWKDEEIKFMLDLGGQYNVGNYSFWIEEEEI